MGHIFYFIFCINPISEGEFNILDYNKHYWYIETHRRLILAYIITTDGRLLPHKVPESASVGKAERVGNGETYIMVKKDNNMVYWRNLGFWRIWSPLLRSKYSVCWFTEIKKTEWDNIAKQVEKHGNF